VNHDFYRYLDPTEIARRFGSKPGFRLVDFVEVALPVFIVPIDAIVVASKPLPLVDEFLLRSVAEGVNTLDDLSGFLGLEVSFVKKRLGALMGQDLLAYSPASGGHASASLTQKGKDALKSVLLVQPKRESFTIAIDGITRAPLLTRPGKLLAIRDVRSFGLLEIRAFPEDRAPEFEEIAAMNLTAAFAAGTKKERQIQRVMSLVHMGRRMRRFRESTMLVFRAEAGTQIHVEFFVNGRPSPDLTNAFARYDGATALHIPEQINEHAARAKLDLDEVLPGFTTSSQSQEAAAKRPKVQAVLKQVAILDSQIEEKEISLSETRSREKIAQLEAELEKIKQERKKEELELISGDFRFVEVHEHSGILDNSLREAKRRLLIISPWIRDQVVTQDRLGNISGLIRRGVEVYIGYGLGEDDKPGKDKGEDAIAYLSHLSSQHENLHFHELGDTHAKILLVDDRYAVVGSFNWLSFAGSAKRNFREEFSVQFHKKEKIEWLFKYFLDRFAGANPEAVADLAALLDNPTLNLSNLPRPETKPLAQHSKQPEAPKRPVQSQQHTAIPVPQGNSTSIVSVEQLAKELGEPVSEVLRVLRRLFPALTEKSPVNQSDMLTFWKAQTQKPATPEPFSSKGSTKGQLAFRAPSPARPNQARPTTPCIPKPPPANPLPSTTPVVTPGGAPSQVKPPALSKPHGPNAQLSPPIGKPPAKQTTAAKQPSSRVKKVEPKPMPIQALAKHLGIPIDSILEDLGWGRLKKTDCVIAHSYVLQLCRKHNRPPPGNPDRL
jgi:hypothetical protein